jgi:hypothetical protein
MAHRFTHHAIDYGRTTYCVTDCMFSSVLYFMFQPSLQAFLDLCDDFLRIIHC